ncbi:hypothetical protein C1H46_043745 [Malus baccata]|uniref:F-box domain-containing protein n=1 Tax=Malus baccata TaxID=106549 RepID=A0A540K910_MALBA|nr:hypothetical protein C1H46_043745 [Malus baccata]
MDLPMDILVDILMKLQPAIKSLSQFRCVSKTALNFIDSPFFAQLHTSRLLNSAASCAATVQVPQLILLAEFDGPNLKSQIGLQLHPFKYTPDARHDDASAIVFKHALPNWKIFCGAFLTDDVYKSAEAVNLVTQELGGKIISTVLVDNEDFLKELQQ